MAVRLTFKQQDDDEGDSNITGGDLDYEGGLSEHEDQVVDNDIALSEPVLPEVTIEQPNPSHSVSMSSSQKTLHNFFHSPQQTRAPGPAHSIAANPAASDSIVPDAVTPMLRKRKRTLEEETTLPAPKKHTSPGTSKAAQHEAKSRADADAGISDAKKMAKFQDKIRKLDPHAEFFVDGNPRNVRHSKCGRAYMQKAGNNTSNFRAHVQACTGPTKNRVHIANVDRSCFKNFTKTSSPLPADSSRVAAVSPDAQNTTQPCPGLTPEYESNILIYLARTQTMGGGARPRNAIAEALFNTKWVSLQKRQRDKVLHTEATEFRWINWKEQGFITSVTCLKEIPSAQEPAQPCGNCRALLNIKIFRNALRRPLPKQENLKFIPVTYRANIAGEQLAKTVGAYEIIQRAAKVGLFSYLPFSGLTAHQQNGTDPFIRFTRGLLQGEYDGTMFAALFEACATKADKERRSVGMQNFQYRVELTDVALLVNMQSPSAYNILRRFIPMHHPRTIR